MIKIVGALTCDGVVVENDPWIEMKVSWVPRSTKTPLYLRISGKNGGEVELKIDPDTGAFNQLVVIDTPPESPTTTPKPTDGDAGLNQVPVISRTMWGDQSDLNWPPANSPVIFDTADLAFAKHEDRMDLVFTTREISKYVHADNVHVGIAEDGTLASIEVAALRPR